MKALKRTKMSEEYAAKGRAPCGAATLAALGVKGHPMGFTLTSVVLSKLNRENQVRQIFHQTTVGRYTLNQFIKRHRRGRYVLRVRDHLMALVNGKLTDTMLYSGGKRQILDAWEVKAKGE